MVTEQEVKNLFQDFLDENGLWMDFEQFIIEKGYTLVELGYDDGN